MIDRPTRISVFRISLTNATMLAAAYLVFATGIELLRRLLEVEWAGRVAKTMEFFPAGVLRALHLFAPLQRAWLEQHVTDTQVRLVYGATVVAMIYVLGLLVGSLMWLAMRLRQRAAP